MSRSIILAALLAASLAGNSSAAQFKPLEQSPAAPVAETSVRETDRQQELDMIALQNTMNERQRAIATMRGVMNALHGNGCEICANIR